MQNSQFRAYELQFLPDFNQELARYAKRNGNFVLV